MQKNLSENIFFILTFGKKVIESGLYFSLKMNQLVEKKYLPADKKYPSLFFSEYKISIPAI